MPNHVVVYKVPRSLSCESTLDKCLRLSFCFHFGWPQQFTLLPSFVFLLSVCPPPSQMEVAMGLVQIIPAVMNDIQFLFVLPSA